MAEAGCAGVLSGLEVDWGISVIASNLTTSSIAILASGQLAADVCRFQDEARTVIGDDAVKRMLSGYCDKGV